MGTILLTRALPEAAQEWMGQNHRLIVATQPGETPLSADGLREQLADCEALACWLNDRIDAATIDAAPRLKVIANYGVGYDNIDAAYARSRGIVVCNTPDVLSDATADIAFGLLLCLARQLLPADRFVRAGHFHGWDSRLFLGRDLQNKRLGIYGMGRIGRAMARRGRGFGMEIVYHNRRRLAPELEAPLGARFVDFDELLETSDTLSLHCPLNDESRHRFGAAEFARAKPGAFLINTARGPVVDETALLDALRSGRLGGAGLDVYEFEPRIVEGLLERDDVVLLPHIGSATVETREAMALLVARNVVNVLEGRPAETPVDG